MDHNQRDHNEREHTQKAYTHGTPSVVGNRLRQARIAVNMSLSDMAKAIHYSKGHLSKVESGNKEPTPELVAKWDTATGQNGCLVHLVQTPPAQLAPRVPLIGRDTELSTARDVILQATRDPDAPHTLIITGPPAIGKSALGVEVAYEVCDHFPDGILAVDLMPEAGRREAGEVLGELLRALLPDRRQRIATSLEERKVQWRTVIAERRVLIMLDNARDTSQILPLLPGASARHAMVVITSRQTLVDLVEVETISLAALRPLAADVAARMLQHELAAHDHPAATSPRACAAVAAVCEGFPLAIKLMARSIGAHPTYPVDQLIADAESGAFVATDAPCPVQARMATSLTDLSDEAGELFTLLGLWAGPSLAREAISALSGIRGHAIDPILTELLQANLIVESDVYGRYTMHPLIHRFAARLAREAPKAHTIRAATRLVSYYLHGAGRASARIAPHHPHRTYEPAHPDVAVPFHRDRAAALWWFRAERASLAHVAALAQATRQYAHCAQLALAMWECLETDGRWDTAWLTTHELGWAAALQIGDRLAYATILTHLSHGMRLARDHDDVAIRQLHAALTDWHDLASSSDVLVQAAARQGESCAHCTLAAIKRDQLMLAEALSHAEEALAVLRDDDREERAIALGLLADILRRNGNVDQLTIADGHVRTAVDLIRDLRGAERRLSWVLSIYAEVHLGWIDTLARKARGLPIDRAGIRQEIDRHRHVAVGALEDSLAAARVAGDHHITAKLLTRLGEVRWNAGDGDGARRAYRDACSIAATLMPSAEQEQLLNGIRRLHSRIATAVEAESRRSIRAAQEA